MGSRALPRRPCDGFTVVELMVVILIVALTLTYGLPAFDGLMDRYRIKSAADTLHSDLQFARSEAIRANSDACVGFATGGAWCYGMNLASTASSCEVSACDCTIADPADAQYCSLRRVTSADLPQIKLPAAGNVTFPGNVTGFEPTRGTTALSTAGSALAGGATFESTGGRRATVNVNAIGRASACSPTDSVPGLPSC
jgi:type IV fimbrial biogenesis protein FimT